MRGRVGGVLGIMVGLLQMSVASSYLSPVVVSLLVNGLVSLFSIAIAPRPRLLYFRFCSQAHWGTGCVGNECLEVNACSLSIWILAM